MMRVQLDTKGFLFVLKFIAVLIWAFGFTEFASDVIVGAVLRQWSPSPAVAAATARYRIKSERSGRNVASLGSAVAAAGNAKIRIGFVGDVMLDRGVGQAVAQYGGGDFRYPFLRIVEDLRDYDVLFGNLEGPVSDQGADQEAQYSFRMDPKAIEGLTFAGFDVVSAANNHTGDWGPEAVRDTFERFGDAGISYVGGGLSREEAYDPKLVTVEDTRIAFVAFTQSLGSYGGTPGAPVIAAADEDAVTQSVGRAKEQADIVIASFHFGTEYVAEPDAYQKRISRIAVRAGADLVVGHHPHVIQPIERYGNAYIAYSLGNFVFDQDFSEETMHGLLLDVAIEDKRIADVQAHPVRLNAIFQPALVSGN